jgi:hypothetical protein
MFRAFVVMGIVLLSTLLREASSAHGEEKLDVEFSAQSYHQVTPTRANFYYNKRAVGTGREAFEEILKRIEKLPRETSVVWGPNYGRCHGCSGDEPACLPMHLYPDLWRRLEQTVAKRGLWLSNRFPLDTGDRFQSTLPSGVRLPATVLATSNAPGLSPTPACSTG